MMRRGSLSSHAALADVTIGAGLTLIASAQQNAPGLSPDGRTAWVGAATHDNGLEFSRVTKHYTHRIDGAIDDERRTLLADLASVNRLDAVGFVPRPTVPASSTNATGDKLTTDGAVAVFQVATGAAPGGGYVVAAPARPTPTARAGS